MTLTREAQEGVELVRKYCGGNIPVPVNSLPFLVPAVRLAMVFDDQGYKTQLLGNSVYIYSKTSEGVVGHITGSRVIQKHDSQELIEDSALVGELSKQKTEISIEPKPTCFSR